jgi:hypothetical protein
VGGLYNDGKFNFGSGVLSFFVLRRHIHIPLLSRLAIDLILQFKAFLGYGFMVDKGKSHATRQYSWKMNKKSVNPLC